MTILVADNQPSRDPCPHGGRVERQSRDSVCRQTTEASDGADRPSPEPV